jgi:transcriptional regulator with XRE-family HTH domain
MAAIDGSRSGQPGPALADRLDPGELRARRRALGLSQAGLAQALCVAPNTVARWERGELRTADASQPSAIGVINSASLISIARFLGSTTESTA